MDKLQVEKQMTPTPNKARFLNRLSDYTCLQLIKEIEPNRTETSQLESDIFLIAYSKGEDILSENRAVPTPKEFMTEIFKDMGRDYNQVVESYRKMFLHIATRGFEGAVLLAKRNGEKTKPSLQIEIKKKGWNVKELFRHTEDSPLNYFVPLAVEIKKDERPQVEMEKLMQRPASRKGGANAKTLFLIMLASVGLAHPSLQRGLTPTVDAVLSAHEEMEISSTENFTDKILKIVADRAGVDTDVYALALDMSNSIHDSLSSGSCRNETVDTTAVLDLEDVKNKGHEFSGTDNQNKNIGIGIDGIIM